MTMSKKSGKEQYLDAKHVVENPNKFDHRDVARAREFCNGYEAGQHETIVMRKDQAIDKLRGQLQNCVNHLHNAKRKLGSRYDFDEVIDHANKALYDSLDA